MVISLYQPYRVGFNPLKINYFWLGTHIKFRELKQSKPFGEIHTIVFYTIECLYEFQFILETQFDISTNN